MRKKKIVFDIALNVFASIIPLMLLQLFILPNVSKAVGGDNYGLIIALIALLNTIPSALGNTLNNIRLLSNPKYIANEFAGDFNLLLLLSSLASVVSVLVISIKYEGGFHWGLLLTLLLSVMWLLRDYFVVEFRIHLNYYNVLKDSILLSCGYTLGFLIFLYVYPAWQFIYIVGYSFSLFFIYRNTSLWREGLSKTPLFPSTSKDFLYLLLAVFLSRLTSYSEKLLIYPILGGTAVAVYYAASIFGKIISVGISPMTSVLLSYLAKMPSKPKNILRLIITVGVLVGGVGFLIINLLGGFVLMFLYPEYLTAALPLIKYAAADAVINIIIVMVNPFVLKFNKKKWQIVIGGATGVVYLLCVALLSGPFGLTGYFLSLIIAHGLKLFVLLLLLSKNPSTNEPV